MMKLKGEMSFLFSGVSHRVLVHVCEEERKDGVNEEERLSVSA